MAMAMATVAVPSHGGCELRLRVVAAQVPVSGDTGHRGGNGVRLQTNAESAETSLPFRIPVAQMSILFAVVDCHSEMQSHSHKIDATTCGAAHIQMVPLSDGILRRWPGFQAAGRQRGHPSQEADFCL